MYMVCDGFQSDGGRVVLGYKIDRLADHFVVFGRNIIKHTVGEYFHGFLKLVAERIKRIDLLQRFQKLIVDFQNIVRGCAALYRGAGEQRA